jgi:hypothetical protein
MDANVLEEPVAYILKASIYHEDGGNRMFQNGIELNLKLKLRIMEHVICV